ncbi:hypothetical protein BS47DRAFT_1376510, partial [Hydnum rufescens UP504]
MQYDPELTLMRMSPGLRIEHSFDDTLKGRLLDVSPPSSRMSGLTSDSENGAPPMDKGKRRELPPIPGPDSTRESPNDDHDTSNWQQDHDQLPREPAPSPSPRSGHRDKPPPLQISVTPSDSSDRERTSSSSASSSLDPYYFSIPSPSEPTTLIPALPDAPNDTPRTHRSSSSKRSSILDPMTPARDPASIDRRVLVGVGELATPRWATGPRDWRGDSRPESPVDPDPTTGEDASLPRRPNGLGGHPDTDDEPVPPPRSYQAGRHRFSIAEESGGEEILYKPPVPRERSHRISETSSVDTHVSYTGSNDTVTGSPVPTDSSLSSSGAALAPPSAFHTIPKAKKRTSEEFERDQFGALISKVNGSSLSVQSDRDNEQDERIPRKHRSLGLGAPVSHKDKPRDRRRTDSTGLSISSGGGAAKPSRPHHSQQSSTSSQDVRRVFTDFPQLPQSSSSTNLLPQLFRSPSESLPGLTSGSAETKQSMPSHHSSPSVAHSLLRGTQEGWSGMDDSSTTEALRKLDGIHGRALRARSSIGSGGLASAGSRTNSRPGTPGTKGATTGWDGREALVNGREKSIQPSTPDPDLSQASQTSNGEVFSDTGDYVVAGGEEFGVTSPVPSNVPVKHFNKEPHTPGSARSSYGLKRGSTSSTSVTTGTPTTTASSRDSVTLSTTTSATSASALSHRHSGGKLRRGSAGSDISSVHSSDFANHKDRVAALASGEVAEDSDTVRIPPVPPLPKAYQSPQANSFAIPPLPSRGGIPSGPSTPADDFDRRGLSKKWSFSSALNLKMPSSPSSKDHSTKSPFHPGHHEVCAAARVMKRGPPILGRSLTPRSPRPIPKSPERSERPAPSRSETSSSASTQTTSQAVPVTSPPAKSLPSSRRLTPSNIPFFRRSSSSSIQVSATTDSPPLPPLPHHAPSASISTNASKSASNHSLDLVPSPSPIQPSAQATRKSSVLSLLKGSASRKSIISEKSDGGKAKEKEDSSKEKRDEKDRSESRISILMGRKRGKVVSPHYVQLPPMLMSALPSATAHRVATLKSRDSVSSMPPPASVPRGRPSTSGVGVTPRSPGAKTSDSSLRSTRHNLPPIAGSPSVGTLGHASSSSHPPLSGASRNPTKIPRISSRTSTLHSPASTMKPSTLLSTRRASLVISNSNNLGSFSGKSELDVPPSPHASFVSDFG